jgi:hypothetical protein
MSLKLVHPTNMTKRLFSVSSVFLRGLRVPGFGLFHQRSFSVDSPTSTSIIVMIQNRTTTWFSFQPFNS